MALDFVTIQPMSAECERLFPAAGLMVTPSRNRIDAHTIGICQVLRSWLRAGIIEELDPMLVPLEDETVTQPSNKDVNAMKTGTWLDISDMEGEGDNLE